MRLMVTRPLQDGLLLAERLAARGHDVLLSPLIHIEAADAALPDPEKYDALAFTSANGVRALLNHCPDGRINDWQKIPAFAVGPQTAAALATVNWPRIETAQGDVTALAALLAEHMPSGARVLHIVGRDRAGDLAALLDAAHMTHDRAVLYRAEAADGFSAAAAAALSDKDDAIDGVLLYSARTAKIFCTLFSALSAPDRPIAYCLSPAVADVLGAHGFETVIAASANEEAMLALF